MSDEATPTVVEAALPTAPDAATATPEKSEDDALRAIYREAMSEPDDAASASASDATDKADAKDAPDRAANGQFLSKNPKLPADVEPVIEKADDAEVKPAEPAKEIKPAVDPGHFRGWSKEAQAKFATLPTETQAFVIERQKEHQATLTKAQQELGRVRAATEPLLAAVQKHAEHFEMQGVKPEVAIDRLASLDAKIMGESTDQAAESLIELAKSYGVKLVRPEVDILADPTSPESEHYALFADLKRQNAMLNARLQSLDRRQQATARQDYTRQIGEFASASDAAGNPAYPHFDMLRGPMIDLLERREANTLQQAYEMAERPLKERITREAEALRKADEAKTAAQRARRAAQLNVTSSAMPVDGFRSEDDLLAATYRRAMAS
jgi:hypothetical protein